MSVLVTALVVGAGALVAGATARLIARRRTKSGSTEPEKPAPAKRSILAEAGFGIEQGDVISVSGRELWLEQGWLLREAGRPIAAVLFAREATLVAEPSQPPRLHLLHACELALPSEPPSALDHGGVRYERARRLPVEIEVLPESPDAPWPSALLVEYRGLGSETLWALVHAGVCRAWGGRVVDDAELELWGGGAGTLVR